jgi:hypothetical protein
MLRPLLLLMAAYALLLAHRAFVRDEALPIGENSPRTRIRQELAQESAVEGPLTQAFEALYERRRAQADVEGSVAAETPGPGPFAFLHEEGDSAESFLEKLAAYAGSESAQRPETQEQILEYALTRPERGQDALSRVAIAALGQVAVPEEGQPSESTRHIFDLAAALLTRNARDDYDLERIKQELMSSRSEDGFATTLEESFSSATKE